MCANFTPTELRLAEGIVHAEAAGFNGLAGALAFILHQSFHGSNHPQEAGASNVGQIPASQKAPYGVLHITNTDRRQFDSVESPERRLP